MSWVSFRHFDDAVVKKWAASAGESIYRAGRGADLNCDSATANTFLEVPNSCVAIECIFASTCLSLRLLIRVGTYSKRLSATNAVIVPLA